MNKISYSQYSLWSNCGHAWKLKYVDGHRVDDTSIHTIFGSVMHEVIQDWLHILYNETETKAKTVYLHDTFKEKLVASFKDNVTISEQTGEKVFLADKKTLTEFYEQGCQILSYIQNNYKKIFPTSNTELYGVEVELDIAVRPNVQYVGFIDIVTYNKLTKKYVLYDLKTSRAGWSPEEKTNPTKIGQLLLYKKFFAEQKNVPEDNISVEFVILKRTIFENSPYPIPRVSKFEPPNKTPSLKKNWDKFTQFIDNCFDANGNYITEQKANPSKSNCRWCVFRDRKELCSVGVTK